MVVLTKLVINFIVLLCEQETAALSAYIILGFAFFFWLVKQDVVKNIYTWRLFLLRLFTFVEFTVTILVCIALLFVHFCMNIDSWQERNSYDVSELVEDVDEQIETSKDCFALSTDYYTTVNGVVCCSVYTVPGYVLTLDNIEYDENLCDAVSLTEDEAAADKYNIVFSGFKNDGVYTVHIKGTDCYMTVFVNSEVSDRLVMTCTPSATEICAGDTLTLSLEYAGADINNGTARMQFDENSVVLYYFNLKNKTKSNYEQ